MEAGGLDEEYIGIVIQPFLKEAEIVEIGTNCMGRPGIGFQVGFKIMDSLAKFHNSVLPWGRRKAAHKWTALSGWLLILGARFFAIDVFLTILVFIGGFHLGCFRLLGSVVIDRCAGNAWP